MTSPISVVIPTYNGAKFLAETIATVHAQTLRPAEIIVVDDGSVDDSAVVAAACGARVIRRENGGICAARNTGILAATQPWIALLDHDDLWAPDKLAQQWRAVERFPEAVLISTDCAVVNADGSTRVPSFAGRDIVHYERLSVQGRDGDCVLHRHAYEELAQTGWFLMPSASLVRREVLVRVGMFDVRTRRWEDTSCFLRVLGQGALVFIQRPLASWVIHETNSHKDVIAMLRGFLQLHDIMQLEPTQYPLSFRRKMDEERPETLLALARAELDVEDSRGAASHAWEAFRLAPSARAVALLGMATLPAVAHRKAISMSRKLRGIHPPSSAPM